MSKSKRGPSETAGTKGRADGPARPAGKVPAAMVVARHGAGTVTREGRGFSYGELGASDLAPSMAAGWGLRIDSMRRSVLEGNVGSLKAWSSGPRAKGKGETEVRKVEEELEKVAEEVKEEAVKVEKEVAKAEKAAKRGAKKVVKKAKAEVKKAKAPPKKKRRKS